MTITWRTDATVASGFVQYQPGPKLPAATPKIKAESRDFTTDTEQARLFTVTLSNLIPNQSYSYRVGDGERWSEKRSFTTANPKALSFKFLAFGDSQRDLTDKPPYLPWRNTVQNAFNENPDARFIVNIGDLVDYGQKGAHWNAWFAGAQGVIDHIPEMASTGNHESYGAPGSMLPKNWIEQFSFPKNGPAGRKQAYSYDYGPVHFIVLDSQQEEQKQYGDILEAQKTWLEADLKASKAIWKIAYFHRSPYTIHKIRNNDEIKKAFSSILEKYHVDLVFSGHDHGVARTFPIKNGAYQKLPSQGTIYYIVGQSGGKTYTDLEKKEWDAFFYNPLDQPDYVVVEVSAKKITITAKKQDGMVIDVYSIAK
jgi:acid phosphatase type 7